MKVEDFDYDLNENLIAQTPIKDRDTSKLLVLDKKTGEIEHKHFYDIIDYLEKGDTLVLNDTKVLPARLLGEKTDTHAVIEILLLTIGTPNSLAISSPVATKSFASVVILL